MKYRIIEEIDGTGISVFYAQYERKSWLGKRTWEYAEDYICDGIKRPLKFDTSKEALFHLKKLYAPRVSAPRVRNIVDEGEL